jgi:hypothetical protein
MGLSIARLGYKRLAKDFATPKSALAADEKTYLASPSDLRIARLFHYPVFR